MRLDFHYDIVAMTISLLMLIMFEWRKKFSSRSIKLFSYINVCIVVTSVLGVISFFIVMEPHMFPLWLNNIVLMLYMFAYNEITVLLFLYIDAKAKIPQLKSVSKTIGIVVTIYFAIAILSSPFTHLVGYFDENSKFVQGPLMYSLYVVPVVAFLLEIVVLIAGRKHFNKYQMNVNIGIMVLFGLTVLAIVCFPSAQFAPLAISIIMFFIYVAYENSAHFTYRNTQCMNRPSFINQMYEMKKAGKRCGIIAFRVQDFDYTRRNRGEKFVNALTTKIADFLYRHYKTQVFVLSEDSFIVTYTGKNDYLSIKQSIQEYFILPIPVLNDVIHANIDLVDIPEIDLSYAVEDIEALIEYRLSNPSDQIETNKLMDKLINEKMRNEKMMSMIKDALANNTFQIYYQPIYNAVSGTFESAEALIRLFDENGNQVNAEELIVFAEQNGFIEQISDFVFRRICVFMHKHDLKEYGMKYVEINLSPRVCILPNLAQNYSNLMRLYKVDPSSINLEITETAALTENKKWLDTIQKLNSIGVDFSIDDFGSGFASANYLFQVPASIVKIDKMILWEAMKKPEAMVVLRSTIEMLHELGKKIVVEGVETEEMVSVLNELGVEYQQGFYYSRPIPEDTFLEFLDRNNRNRK